MAIPKSPEIARQFSGLTPGGALGAAAELWTATMVTTTNIKPAMSNRFRVIFPPKTSGHHATAKVPSWA
jgi:hypothetical protein